MVLSVLANRGVTIAKNLPKGQSVRSNIYINQIYKNKKTQTARGGGGGGGGKREKKKKKFSKKKKKKKEGGGGGGGGGEGGRQRERLIETLSFNNKNILPIHELLEQHV